MTKSKDIITKSLFKSVNSRRSNTSATELDLSVADRQAVGGSAGTAEQIIADRRRMVVTVYELDR